MKPASGRDRAAGEGSTSTGSDRSLSLPRHPDGWTGHPALRRFVDRCAGAGIAVGGVGVLVTVLGLFFYLLYEVAPLFRSAQLEAAGEYQLLADAPPLHLLLEEQAKSALRLDGNGNAVFFDPADGALRARIPLTDGARVAAFALDSRRTGIFALGLDDGSVMVARLGWQTGFNSAGGATPPIPFADHPFGTEAFSLPGGLPAAVLAIRTDAEGMSLAALGSTGQLSLMQARRRESLLSPFESSGTRAATQLDSRTLQLQVSDPRWLFIDAGRRLLFVVDAAGLAQLVDLRAAFDGAVPALVGTSSLVEPGRVPSHIEFLPGGHSLLVANDEGTIAQWLPVRERGGPVLQRIRSFPVSPRGISALTTEQRRRNFAAADEDGQIILLNTTAERRILQERLVDGQATALALAPGGDALLVERAHGRFNAWSIRNPHPEVSLSSLWREVWYEGYREPARVWQSSSASDDYEPKYSLIPLTFGTLKAAFYAMLFAVPLAIGGAIFTGYFMAPAMRRKTRPMIELMEALPTVVLGFLAGLWLAPLVESNLAALLALLVLLPGVVLMASLLWLQLPPRWRQRVPDGWEAALLAPVIVLTGVLAFTLGAPLELVFFNGDLPDWLNTEMGISYDQRNAMIVGVAMGFAVIPSIFSIAEDAVFTVPGHLGDGSLALGGTAWQTLWRVVLPMASPGIFSALMIGLGRAVGETMIVLMATGNTPIMDANIFEGMRTLAANIAIEAPESEVGSTHYRILFLTALVLFLFTFTLNTVAEVARQRLRRRYAAL